MGRLGIRFQGEQDRVVIDLPDHGFLRQEGRATLDVPYLGCRRVYATKVWSEVTIDNQNVLFAEVNDEGPKDQIEPPASGADAKTPKQILITGCIINAVSSVEVTPRVNVLDEPIHIVGPEILRLGLELSSQDVERVCQVVWDHRYADVRSKLCLLGLKL